MGIFSFLSGKNKNSNGSDDALENIEVDNGVFLPKAFAAYWEQIKKTGLEYIEIKASPANDIKATESSFGAIPFIPSGFNYPVDKDGKQMTPLAQLNFSEIPHLKNYPEKGLLQFYISDNDCYGLDFNNQYNPDSFRIIYIENPEQLQEEKDIDFVKQLLQSENTPVFKPHRLSFSKKTDYVGLNDYRSNLHGFSVNDWVSQYSGNINSKLEDLSYELFATNGHRIGGYAYFTQTDPREYMKMARDTVLLFQMDSDNEIMWGDVGVGNFFIKPQDLAAKDFSKVLYNWDCC